MPPTSARARKAPINVTIDIALLERLDEVVASQGISRSEFLRRLVEDYLDDAALAEVAEERMRAIREGRDVPLSLDAVRAELGL